jgi:hypothetical protein
MGVFNIKYHLLSQTPPDAVRPLVFTSEATSQQLTFDTQLPLNRMAERNAYRTALINYQTARRSLMALEDSIAVQVRFDVRQLQLFVANYRNQQRVVHSLYKQVAAAKELVFAPAQGTQGDPVAGAALTNQYLGALGQLNTAQVKMYDIWLSTLATRMQLYLDLEMMPMDDRGVWIDELGSLTGGAERRRGTHDHAQPGPECLPVQPVSLPVQPVSDNPVAPAARFGSPVSATREAEAPAQLLLPARDR